MRRRLTAAAAATLLTLFAGCQANKQEAPADHHDLYGIWSMDFTRPADSQQEFYPPFKQYAFYSDDVFFTPHFWSSDGQNLAFGYSGCGLEMRGGQLVDVFGQPMDYRFVSDNTFQTTWKKQEDDNSLVNAELVTDQWSRSTPDSVVMNLFHAACKADQAHNKPLDGVWRADGNEEEGWMLLVNGDIMLTLSYQQTDSAVYKFSGAGFFSTVVYDNDSTLTIGSEKQVFHWEQRDKNQIAMIPADDPGNVSLLRRTALPRNVSRMLNATLIENP